MKRTPIKTHHKRPGTRYSSFILSHYDVLPGYELVSYFVCLRILSPYFQNIHGMGAMANVKNANILVAHPTPRLSYICNENSGNAALRVYLDNMAAPAAEAPYRGPYASIMKRFEGA